jgi:branched-chain amino acid transport system permease protein
MPAFDILAQQIVNGITIGMCYALLGMGLALIFGIFGIINFAQGEFFMIAAFVTFWFMQLAGLDYFTASLAAICVTIVLGYCLQRLVVNPLQNTDHANILLATFAVSLLLRHTMQIATGGAPQKINSPLGGIVEIGPVIITEQRAFVVVFGCILIAAVAAMLKWTSLGRVMRATAQNGFAAAVSGVNIARVQTVTFAMGIGLAAVAGVLVGPISPMYADIGGVYIIKGFAVIILGGLGSLVGAALAGLLLGLVEALGSGYLSSTWREALAFIVLILVLLTRPTGLLGRAGKSA